MLNWVKFDQLKEEKVDKVGGLGLECLTTALFLPDFTLWQD